MNRRQITSLWAASVLFLFLSIAPILFAELINDGSFESVPTTWEEYFNTACNAPAIGNWSTVVGAPPNFDGQQSFWAGGACNNVLSNNGARKDIALESNAAILSFWFNPIKGPDPINNDTAVVAIDETPVWTLNVDGINTLAGWKNALVDISEFSGDTVTLSLEMQHDNDSDVANVFFDYIEVFHPSIQISQLASPEAVLEGEPFSVEVTVENNGDIALNNLSITNTNFANCDRPIGSLPDLEPGESSNYTCQVASAVSNLANTILVNATASALELLVEAENTILSPVANPLLELTVVPDEASVSEGEQITFSLTITNSGDSDLVTLRLTSVQATGCNLSLGSFAAGQTAVFNCSYAPPASGMVTFVATALEPRTNTNISAETAVSIEIVPNTPPTVISYSVYLPMATNYFLNHSALGEPNDVCEQAFSITPNQTTKFLAEDIDDWYKFTLGTPGDMTVDLTNFVPIAGQITVWRGSSCQNLTLIGQNGDFSSEKRINLANQPPGTYFVWLINDGPMNNSSKYNLLVTTP